LIMFLGDEILEAAIMATSTPALHPLPTGTTGAHHHHSTVGPVPTVLPGPSVVYDTRGATGERTLWVVFVGMFISSLAFYVLAWRQPVSKRLFHVLTAFITTFATLSYFAMAVGQGISYNTQTYNEKHAHGLPDTTVISHREFYYARYIDWTLTTPLLLLDLAFLAGLNGSDIIVSVVADLIMILTGLFAGLTEDTRVSYAWYALGCIALLVIIFELAVNGRNTVKTKGTRTASFFLSIASFTLLLWVAYPIIWALGEGSRILSLDGEILAYAVLDILAKPVFGFWLIFTHDAVSSSSLNVGGFWSHGLNNEGGIQIGDDEDGA